MKITLLGNPLSTNSIYKHHGKISYMSKEGKELKISYQFQAKSQYHGELLKGELSVIIQLFFGDKRKRDYDNYGKLLNDSLQGIIFKDDSQIMLATISKDFSKENPRIEIEINEL